MSRLIADNDRSQRTATGRWWLALFAIIVIGCGKDEPQGRPSNRAAEHVADGAAQVQSVAGNEQLRIAAASDLKFALDDIVSAFNRQHAGAQVTVGVGSSGNFLAQLSNKAPFDLFLSADIEYAQRLVEQGHSPPGSAFPYARGHIVLWTLKDSPYDVDRAGIEIPRAKEVKTIAIANPQTAPYGRAAVAALRSLGIYEAVEPKLVYGESVAQAAQMVESGAADLGIIALSLAVSPVLRDKGKFWKFPVDSYPPIIQGGVILSWADNARLAGEFRDFLLSGQGAAILKEFGFEAPGL